MSRERKIWLCLVVITVLVASGVGFMIYTEHGNIEDSRTELTTLKTNIATSRKTIESTTSLEHEVIVLREIAEVMRAILPDDSDIHNLIRDFYKYSGQAEVKPSSFKPKSNPKKDAGSGFDKVAYTLMLEGDIFQFLAFLNKIETHHRFMSVPNIKLTSATRSQIEEDGYALHRIQLDVETYVYTRKGNLQDVRIEGYERKRDLLAGEINRRRQALTLTTFHYRGARGRRDPWIDPRVPAIAPGLGAWTVQEQMDKVEELSDRMSEAQDQWEEVGKAINVLDQMVKKSDLLKSIAMLEEDLRILDAGAKITYVPAQKRLKNDVFDPLDILKSEIDQTATTLGPPREAMEQMQASMIRHIDRGEYALALQAFEPMESSLDQIQGDPARLVLAKVLLQLKFDAETLLAFERIEMDFGGGVFIEGRAPVLIINGRSLTIGDMLGNELEILDIRPNEIDFYFRGVVLTRLYGG